MIGADVADRAMKAEAENLTQYLEFVNESFQMSVYALVLSVARRVGKFAGAEATMMTLELAGKSKSLTARLTGLIARQAVQKIG